MRFWTTPDNAQRLCGCLNSLAGYRVLYDRLSTIGEQFSCPPYRVLGDYRRHPNRLLAG
jgi:hypothetical protein